MRSHVANHESLRFREPGRLASHVCFALAAIVLAAALPASAQTCISPARGVPPYWKPPVWWGSSPTSADPMGCVGSNDPQCATDAAAAIAAHCAADGLPAYCSQLDDPRWEGSSAITNGADENTFVFGQDGTTLYLSWRYRGPLGSNINFNTLTFGYEDKNYGPVIVTATLQGANNVQDGGQKGGFVQTVAKGLDTSNCVTGGTISPACPLKSLATQPGWLANTRVWINDPVPGFAVNMALPLGEIANSSGPFPLWFEMLADAPVTPVMLFTWPAGLKFTYGFAAGEACNPPTSKCPQQVYPDKSLWKTFKVSTGPGDQSCPAQGVSLQQSLIAVGDPPSNVIQWAMSPNPKPTNVIWARPTNQTTGPITKGSLMATFRMANWGSNPNFPDWEQGVSVDDLWHPLPCGTVGTKNDIAAGQTADSTNQIECSWTLSDTEAAPFQSGARNPHECILVQMSDNVGLVYENQSVWNNFEVRQASVVKEKAEISVRKLKPIAADGRDVYVYVETLNMPAQAPPADCRSPVSVVVNPASASVVVGGGTKFTATVVGASDAGVTWSIQQGREGGSISADGAYTAPQKPGTYTIVATSNADKSRSGTATVSVFGMMLAGPDRRMLATRATPPARRAELGNLPCAISQGKVSAADVARMIGNGQLSAADADALLPTYRVRVYHDTGETLKLGGQDHPIIRPQGSFGYRMVHNGDLLGWRSELQFDPSYKVDELAPNFYRVHKVPNDAVMNVTTLVEAIEPKKYSVGLHAGFAIPASAMSAFSTNLALTLDFEYAFTRTFSVLVAGGRDAFSGKSPQKDLGIWRFQALARGYFPVHQVRLLGQLGIGSYTLDPGSTRPGGSLGVGFDYPFTPSWEVEVTGDWHAIKAASSSSSDVPRDQFSYFDFQLGARDRF